MDPTQTDVMSTVITQRLLYSHFLLIILTKSTHYSLVSSKHLLTASARTHVGTLRIVYKLYQVVTVESKL